jgi:hypothetical protein
MSTHDDLVNSRAHLADHSDLGEFSFSLQSAAHTLFTQPLHCAGNFYKADQPKDAWVSRHETRTRVAAPNSVKFL